MVFCMSISPIPSYMMSMYVPSSAASQKVEENDYEYQLIMQELALYGLVPSGDKDTDKMRLETAQRIDYEIYMAYTDEEREYYEALKDEVEEEYNSAKRDRISFSGATQLSSINRYMMLGI